jgi:hypothetical protein
MGVIKQINELDDATGTGAIPLNWLFPARNPIASPAEKFTVSQLPGVQVRNGLSLDPIAGIFSQLGQNIGQVGSPADIFNEREFPMNGFSFAFNQDNGGAAVLKMFVEQQAAASSNLWFLDFTPDARGGSINDAPTVEVFESIFFDLNAVNVYNGDRNNYVVNIGTNIIPPGARHNANQASWFFSLEHNFQQNPANPMTQMEGHLIAVTQNGTGFRTFSFYYLNDGTFGEGFFTTSHLYIQDLQAVPFTYYSFNQGSLDISGTPLGQFPKIAINSDGAIAPVFAPILTYNAYIVAYMEAAHAIQFGSSQDFLIDTSGRQFRGQAGSADTTYYIGAGNGFSSAGGIQIGAFDAVNPGFKQNVAARGLTLGYIFEDGTEDVNNRHITQDVNHDINFDTYIKTKAPLASPAGLWGFGQVSAVLSVSDRKAVITIDGVDYYINVVPV